jgi:hypothetical protein
MTDEEALNCFFVRVSPRFFGTNERPSAAGAPQVYGKKGGGDSVHDGSGCKPQ